MADDAVLGLNTQPFITALQQAQRALAEFEASAGRTTTGGGDAGTAEAERLLRVLQDVERGWERVGKAQRAVAETTSAKSLTQQNLPGGSVGDAVSAEAKAAIDRLQNIGATAINRLGPELGTRVAEITQRMSQTVASQAVQAFRSQAEDMRAVIARRKADERPIQAPAATQPGGIIGPQVSVRRYANTASSAIARGIEARPDPNSVAATRAIQEQERQQLATEVSITRATNDRLTAERAAAQMTEGQTRQLASLYERRNALVAEQTRLQGLTVPTGKIFENAQFGPNGEIRARMQRGGPLARELGVEVTPTRRGSRAEVDQAGARAQLSQALQARQASAADAVAALDRDIRAFERGVIEAARAANVFTDTFQRVTRSVGYNTTNGRFEAAGTRQPVTDETQIYELQRLRLRSQFTLRNPELGNLQQRLSDGASDVRRISGGGKDQVYDERLERVVNARTGVVEGLDRSERILQAETDRLGAAQRRLGSELAQEANAKIAARARGGDPRYRAIEGRPDVYEDTQLKRAIDVRSGSLLSSARSEAVLAGERDRLGSAQRRLGAELAADANARVAERARGGDARYRPVSGAADVFEDTQLGRALNVRTGSLFSAAQTEQILQGETDRLRAAQQRLGTELAAEANRVVAERARGGDARYRAIDNKPDVFEDTQLGRAVNVRTGTLLTAAQTDAALSAESGRLLAAQQRLGVELAAEANARVAAAAAAGNARYTPIANQPDVYLDNQLGRAVNTRTGSLLTAAQTDRALGRETDQLKAAQRRLGAELNVDANRAVADRARSGDTRYRPIQGQNDLYEDTQLGRAINVRTGTVLSAAQSEAALLGEQTRLGAALAAETTARLAAAAATEQGARFLFGSANLVERGPGQVSDTRTGRQLTDRQAEIALEQERGRIRTAQNRAETESTRATRLQTRDTQIANVALLNSTGAVVETAGAYRRLTDAATGAQRTFRLSDAGRRAEELQAGDPRLDTARDALARQGARNDNAALVEDTRARLRTRGGDARYVENKPDLAYNANLDRAVNLRTNTVLSLQQTEAVLDAEQKRLGSALAAEANAALRRRADTGQDARYLTGSRNVVEDTRSGQLVNVANGRLLNEREREIALSQESTRIRGRVNDVETARIQAIQEDLGRTILRGRADPSTLPPGVTLETAGQYNRLTNANGAYGISRMIPGTRRAEDLLPGDPRNERAIAALDKARTDRATQALLESTRSRVGTDTVRPISGAADIVEDKQLGRAVNLRTNTILTLDQTEQVLIGEERRLGRAAAELASALLVQRARAGQDARFLAGSSRLVEDQRNGTIRDVNSNRDLTSEQRTQELIAERRRISTALNRGYREQTEIVERQNASMLQGARRDEVAAAGRFRRFTDNATGQVSTFRLNDTGERAKRLEPGTPAYETATRALGEAARADTERARATELLAAVERGEAQRLSNTLIARNGSYYQLTNGGTRAQDLNGFAAYNARQNDPSQRSIGANFLAGLTSRGFGGGGGKGFDIGGLAQSAGTTVKYSGMYDALNLVQGAAVQAGASLLNYEDSIAGLNLAFRDGEHATQPFINDLQEIAASTGQNVGDVMDQASIAMRAFGESTGATNDELKQFAGQFSTIASRQAFLTGQTTVQAGNNLRAGASSLTGGKTDSLDAVSLAAQQYGDASAGAAKRFGADPDDVAEGFRTIATQATQAGLSAAQAANLVAIASTRLGESGQQAGTRLQRILSIIGGSEGQNALAQLNLGLNQDQKIDLSAGSGEQLEQLSAIYDSLNEKQKTFITNKIGGTANSGEFVATMNAGDEIFGGGEYAGAQLEEYERRMKSLSGYIFQLKGNVEGMWTAFTQSGVIGPLKIVAFTLLEITKAVRNTLEAANALASGFGKIPDVVREIGVSLLAVYAVIRLINGLRATTGVRNGISGAAARAEAAVNPEKALARQTLRGQAGPGAATPGGAAGSGTGASTRASDRAIARATADVARRQANVDALRASGAGRDTSAARGAFAPAGQSSTALIAAQAGLRASTARLAQVRAAAGRTEGADSARYATTMRQALRARQDVANTAYRTARDERNAAQERVNAIKRAGDPAAEQARQRAQSRVDRLTRQGVAADDPRMRAAVTRLNQTPLAQAEARLARATAEEARTRTETTRANQASRANIRDNSRFAGVNNFLGRQRGGGGTAGAGLGALRGIGAGLGAGVRGLSRGLIATDRAAERALRNVGGNVRDAYRQNVRTVNAPALTGLNNAANAVNRGLGGLATRLGTAGPAISRSTEGLNQRFQRMLRNPAFGVNEYAGRQRLGTAYNRLDRAQTADNAGSTRDTRRELARARYEVQSSQDNLRGLGARNPYTTQPSRIGSAVQNASGRIAGVASAATDRASRAASAAARAAAASSSGAIRGLAGTMRIAGQAAASTAAGVGALARGGMASLRAGASTAAGAVTTLNARIDALARKAAASNFATSARSSVGNFAQEVKSSLGGIFGVLIAVQALSMAWDAQKKYIEADTQAVEALSMKSAGTSAADFRAVSEAQKTAASNAKEASSGFFGTIADLFGGNSLSNEATQLKASADAYEAAAKRAEEATKRNATSTDPTLDLSSTDALDTSIKALQDSGRDATTVFNALSTALRNSADAAAGNIPQLSQEQIDQVAADATGLANTALGSSTNDIDNGRNPIKRFLGADGPKIFGKDFGDWSLAVPVLGSYLSGYANSGQDSKAVNNLRDMSGAQKTEFDDAIKTSISGLLAQRVDLGSAEGKTKLRATLRANLNSLFEALGLSPEQINLIIDSIAQDVAKRGAAAQSDGSSANEDPATKQQTLASGLQTGIQAAQTRAQYAATKFSGDVKSDPQSSAELTSAESYRDDLQRLRREAAAGGATQETLETLDREIATASNAVTDATVKNMASLAALSQASIPSTDQIGQLDAQIASLKKQYDATTDVGARRDLQTQAIALAQQRYVANQSAGQAQDLADQGIYNNVGQAEAKQRAADQNLRRIQRGFTVDVNGQEVAISGDKRSEAEAQARIAAAQAAADVQTARRARTAAQSRATIDPRDAVANAEQDVTDAQAEVDALNGVAGADVQRAQAQRTLTEKQQAASRARNDLTAAINSASVFPGDELAAARVSMENAAAALAQEKEGTAAFWQAKATLNQQQYAYAQAQVASRAQAQRLNIDLTNPVQTAKAQLDQARDALRTAQAQPGVTDEVLNPLKEAVRNSEAGQEQAAFAQRLQDAQFADSMSGTSHQAYLRYLRNEHDRLTQRLSVMKDTDNGYRQTVEQLQQIDQAMKSASDSLNSQFNIGDIKVPTPFEVRRSIDKQLSGLGYDRGSYNNSSTQNVEINVNGADIAAVMKVITGALSTSTAAGVNQIYAATARKVGS